MENKYEKRLKEIDDRIAYLSAQRGVFGRAPTPDSAIGAEWEKAALIDEKKRILDGTQEKIDQIQEQISELEQLKSQCHAINFIRRMKLNGEIKGYEKQKSTIMKR